MVRVSIQLKLALGLSILILIALLWKIPEPLQDDSLWTDKIVHLLIFMILAISYLNVSTKGFKNFKFRNFGKKSLTELEELIDEKGLHFGFDIAKYNLDNE